MNRTTEAAAMLTVGSHGSSPLPDARDIDLLLYRDLRSMEQRDNKGGTAIIRPLQYVEMCIRDSINTIRKRIDKLDRMLQIDWDSYISRLKIEILLQFLEL